MTIDPVRYWPASTAPVELRAMADQFASRFSTSFSRITHLPRGALAELHADQGHADPAIDPLRVASARKPSVIDDVRTLTTIANGAALSYSTQVRYFDALLSLIGSLDPSPADLLADPECMFVAPEREGRWLAETLGYLPLERSIFPSAKRLLFDGGLAVGLGQISHASSDNRTIAIVDGVIASGATVIALVDVLAERGTQIHVFAAHSTAAGARAIARFSANRGISCSISLAHVSGTLNDHFYAVEESDPGMLVLGDVGDTIAGVASSRTA